MTTSIETNETLFSFTGGRWLRRDQEERNARYLRFDFDALRREVLNACDGATAIISHEKIDSIDNKVIIFKTDNGKKVVAKLPFKMGSPLDLTVRSEVATVKYLQAKTSIPTPKILAFNSDVSNPVGTAFIITEHARGVQLSTRWNTMSMEEKSKCIQSIHEKLKPMVDLELPAYGNIYETFYAKEVSLSHIPIDQDFCIGPSCSAEFWDGRLGDERFYHQIRPNRGPWQNFEEYCNGRIDSSIAAIPFENSPVFTATSRPSWHGSPSECTQALEQLRFVMKTVSNDPKSQAILDSSKPMMWPYLPKRHIFVSESDPAIITDIIDTDSTPIQASFMHSSAFITFLEPKFPPDQEDDQLMQIWIQNTMQYMRKLMAPMFLSQTFFRPIATCDIAWHQGVPSLNWALQELRNEWGKLGFDSACPIPYLGEEREKQLAADHSRFEAVMHLQLTITPAFNCRPNGYVPIENWIEAMRLMTMVWPRIKDNLVNLNKDGVMISAADMRLAWPWDIPSQIGEDLVLITPRYITTALPGLFTEEKEPTKEEKAKVKEAEKHAKKEKGESKGLFKGLKKRFG